MSMLLKGWLLKTVATGFMEGHIREVANVMSIFGFTKAQWDQVSRF